MTEKCLKSRSAVELQANLYKTYTKCRVINVETPSKQQFNALSLIRNARHLGCVQEG